MYKILLKLELVVYIQKDIFELCLRKLLFLLFDEKEEVGIDMEVFFEEKNFYMFLLGLRVK